MPLGVRDGVKLDGDLELANLLRELPGRVERKGLRAAVTAGAAPVVQATRRNVARDTGLAKKSIGRKIKQYRQTAVAVIGAKRDVQAIVNTRRGKRKAVPANYLHLIEGGAKPHTEVITTKNGAQQTIHHPGAKAKPALRPAYEETKQAAREAMTQKLSQVVEAEARKLGKL